MSGQWDAGEDRVSDGKRRKLDRLGALIAGLIRIWGATWRIREDRVALERARKASPDGAVIYVFWHNRIIMLTYACRGRNIQVLRSGSKDGQLIAAVNERLGFGMPAGSSSRGGAAGLRKLVQSARRGLDTGITVDGPRGPRGRFQGGALQLAALSGCPLVPITGSSARGKVFDSWDRTILPWPFSRVEVRYGEPIHVPRGLSEDEMEALRVKLEGELRDFHDAVDLECDREPTPPHEEEAP